MDDDTKSFIGFVLGVLLFVGLPFGGIGIAAYINTNQDENYCRTIPLDRMDKERCGVK